jgi:hypothetical protein
VRVTARNDEADLTKINTETDTSDVVAAVGEHGEVRFDVPDGWLPENEGFLLAANRDPESGLWEAIIPAYSIAGQGESLDAAIENAGELLLDYFVLSARDGLSYWDTYRPLPMRARLLIYAGAVSYIAVRKLRERQRRRRHRAGGDHSYFRLPLQRERTAH